MLTEHICSVRAVALPSRWSCERGENEAWMTSHLQSQENLAEWGQLAEMPSSLVPALPSSLPRSSL